MHQSTVIIKVKIKIKNGLNFNSANIRSNKHETNRTEQNIDIIVQHFSTTFKSHIYILDNKYNLYVIQNYLVKLPE